MRHLTVIIGLFSLLILTSCTSIEPSDDDAGDDDSEGDDDGGDDDSGDDDGGDDDSGDDDGADDDGGDDDSGDDDTTPPENPLTDVVLYINVGDSLAAGYNASGNNGNGGQGYARLLVDNHAAYPAYAAATLTAVSGPIDFRDLGDSGATSGEALDNLQSALNGSLPASVNGDVLLTISAGGNDFNDSIWTMVTPALTQACATQLRQNLAQMVSLVRARYEDLPQGKQVHVVFMTIHDPTGGQMSIPPQFEDGFCGTIQNDAFQLAGPLVMQNLQTMNTEIAAEAQLQSAYLCDNHAVFYDHGMNATGNDRWIDSDCAHPLNEGHHQIRREIWGIITGEWY